MKKLTLATLIILGVGLAMVVVGAVLDGIAWNTTSFDGAALATALTNIGYIASMLSGVVLTGTGIAYAIRSGSSCNCGDDCKCGCKDEEKKSKKD